MAQRRAGAGINPVLVVEERFCAVDVRVGRGSVVAEAVLVEAVHAVGRHPLGRARGNGIHDQKRLVGHVAAATRLPVAPPQAAAGARAQVVDLSVQPGRVEHVAQRVALQGVLLRQPRRVVGRVEEALEGHRDGHVRGVSLLGHLAVAHRGRRGIEVASVGGYSVPS